MLDRSRRDQQPRNQDHEATPPSSRNLCSPAFCSGPPFSPPACRRKCLFSGEGPGKGRPDYGRLRPNMALGFRRSTRAAPLWPANGPLRPERRHTAGGTAVGLGKPRRPPRAATRPDFRGRGGPPRPARAQTQTLAPPFPVRGWWASCQGRPGGSLPVPAKGRFMTQRTDGPDRGAKRGICVRFTRLRNLCRGYSMTRQQNGTCRQPGLPTALQSDNGPLGLHRLRTRNVATFAALSRQIFPSSTTRPLQAIS